jgi:protein-S-isoprenylcysteine O-methyltransferase Ste14
MERVLAFLYGLVTYGVFLLTFLYAIGFVTNLVVPKSIDTGVAGPVGQAVLVNVLLLGLFGLQHSVMARPAFKSWWTRIVPEPVERSTFVLATCVVLGVLFWQWRPILATVWDVDHSAARAVLAAIGGLGWGIVLYSTVLIDHFDLFGLRQVTLYLRNRPYKHHPFMERSLYRLIRHPLMTGFLVAFWFTPTMTVGRLLFAIATTLYVLVAIQLEERDLLRFLGEDYRRYRQRTPMILPWIKGRRRESREIGSERSV